MRTTNGVEKLVSCLAVLSVLATLPAVAAAVDESKLYPLNTCPVSGEKLGEKGAPVVKVYDGREVRFCCEGCVSKFEEKKDEYFKKIDAQIVEQQKAHYPTDMCIVMGQKLEPGKTVEYLHNNRLILFCCKGCVESFKKEPEKFLAKLDEAVIAKQKPAYPLKDCVVCGQKLDDKAIDTVFAGSLVRVCSEGCLKAFEKNPAKYLDKLGEAAKAQKK